MPSRWAMARRRRVMLSHWVVPVLEVAMVHPRGCSCGVGGLGLRLWPSVSQVSVRGCFGQVFGGSRRVGSGRCCWGGWCLGGLCF